jgi:hypothetical protein
MSKQIIDIIESIERLIDIELKPSIHARDERACLIRMKANAAELKFLVAETMAHDKESLK